jgi:hypothetical protein
VAHHRLSGVYFHRTSFRFNAKRAFQHHSELIERGRLTRLDSSPRLRMWATLAASSPESTRPTYSSINLGLLPATSTRVEVSNNFGIKNLLNQ